MIIKTARAYTATLFVTGEGVVEACQEFCNDVGLCVSIKENLYVFTGGSEKGYEITLINYPRFPKTPDDIWKTAEKLAVYLMTYTNPNGSYTLQDSEGRCIWVSNRPGDQE